MKENFKVEGMHCPSCVFALKYGLTDLDGVEDAEVSLDDENAIVEYDEKKVNVKDFKKVADELGFKIID